MTFIFSERGEKNKAPIERLGLGMIYMSTFDLWKQFCCWVYAISVHPEGYFPQNSGIDGGDVQIPPLSARISSVLASCYYPRAI